jgi:hypothetical protein
MALKIGFANKYYTLWDVTSEDMWSQFNGKSYKSHTKTIYTYYQNLSMDLEEAQKKASKKGCKDLSPNDELKGQHKSWKNTVTYARPSYEVWQFVNGKYEGDDIRENNDLSYLKWYQKEKDCSESAKRICQLDDGYVIDSEIGLIKKSALANIKVIASVYEGKRVVEAVSNFSDVGHGDGKAYVKVLLEELTEEDRAFNEQYPYGFSLGLKEEGLDLVHKNYKGFDYFVPRGSRSFKKSKFTVNKENIILV